MLYLQHANIAAVIAIKRKICCVNGNRIIFRKISRLKNYCHEEIMEEIQRMLVNLTNSKLLFEFTIEFGTNAYIWPPVYIEEIKGGGFGITSGSMTEVVHVSKSFISDD